MPLQDANREPGAMAPPAAHTQLRGRWLTIVRVAWLLIASLTVGLFIAGIPARFDRLLNLASGSGRILLDFGPRNFYAVYLSVLDLAIVLAHAVIAAVIFWRKSDDWLALFVAFTFVTAPLAVMNALGILDSSWRLLVNLVSYIGLVFSIGLLYLFPDGRFIPQWTGLLGAVWAVLNVPAIFFPNTPFNFATWPQPLPLLVLLYWSATGLYAQIYRYMRVSDPTQRQQTKWAVLGLGAAILGPLQYFMPFVTLPSLSQPGLPNLFYQLVGPTVFKLALILQLVGFTLFTLGLLVTPLSFGIAILRYRLWDIDIIIRRTLVYGALTGMVAGVYALVVGGLSALLPTQSDLLFSIVALGLIALVFQPLRRRLRNAVDRLIPVVSHPVTEAQSIVPTPLASRPPTPAHEEHAHQLLTMGEPRSIRLCGPWHAVARAVWIVIAGLALALFIALAPINVRSIMSDMEVFTGAQAVSAFVSRQSYAMYILTLRYIAALVFFLTAVVIFWRKSDDRMAIFVSLTCMTIPFLFNFGGYTETWYMYPAPWRRLLPFINDFVQLLGLFCFLFFLYLFPDGRFAPRWMRLPAGLSGALLGLFFAAMLFNLRLPLYVDDELTWRIFVATLLGSVIIPVCGQIYRYWRVSRPVQRQQTKWVVFGLAAFCLWMLSSVLLGDILSVSRYAALYAAISVQGNIFIVTLIPLSLGVAILRYRLWDVDVIIRRTLIYGALVATLALVYFGSVALLQFISQALTGPQSNLVIVATTLAIGALFQPVRRRVQEFIDRRFYREKVDFRVAFTAFAREVRTVIELPELLRVLVNRTTDLLHIAHGAVFLRDESGEFQLAEARNLSSEAGAALSIDAETLDRLQEGAPILQPNDKRFPLLVPLIAPEAGGQTAGDVRPRLIGVLALGPRLSDQHYSHEDQALLTSLADQAGTAIHVAQLIEEKQAEARRREETERQLEARRNSPIGRAEAAAQAILSNPRTALIELHRLATEAGQDPAAAQLLEHLPRAMGLLDDPRTPRLTGFANGFNYLFFSQFEPELLAVGLRTLIAHLELVATSDERPTTNEGDSSFGIAEAAEALALYRLCGEALDAGSIAQITERLPRLPEPGGRDVGEDRRPDHFLADLHRALADLHAAAVSLRAYERVDTSQDRLAYLAGAVERLSRLDRLARAELGGADRPLIQRIAEQWLALATGAMSELQIRAQLVCRLLTRHTWQDDMIPLVLSVRNDGRGAALNLSICLAPAPEYALLDEAAQHDRLASGEEAQVTLRVRPRLAEGASQFRARFLIRYADPRGPDQVEHFADEVQLLADEGTFQFIPNPYVVGTPLQSGSPLFFGRRDLLAFIKENLQAAHRNNLVLIGQRRTGKTSLLKQLPARLGDDYLPVYLDGQSLGLDPGLPNFFLALATEIAFALDDRGFSVAPPELSDFTESPAAAFERSFLPQVREAIGERHLLLLLDEFEELEGAVRRGSLDPSVFSFLRHLIQHAERLSVIFCGTHRLEELAADYWSVLFNISLYRHVGFLERDEAERLIQEPVAPYGMRYDGLALEKIWRVTAGHPYFLQLLCHSLVNRHNRGGRSYVTIADVNAALDEILAAGEAHFVYLWAESNQDERLALGALSHTIPLTGRATPAQVEDELAERGVTVERRAVAAALHRLALRDILTAADGDSALGEAYQWKLGLLGLWVEKYRSLSRVVSEVRP